MQTLLIGIVFSALGVLHEFHITHTTIHFTSQMDTMEVTIKVALEDLEKALADQGAKDLRIGTPNEDPQAEKYIRDYFTQRLRILPNNKPSTYTWIGKEISKDLHDLYVYGEIPCGQIDSLTVENTIFTEIFSDQSNVVHIEHGNSKHNLPFSNSKSRWSVALTD